MEAEAPQIEEQRPYEEMEMGAEEVRGCNDLGLIVRGLN